MTQYPTMTDAEYEALLEREQAELLAEFEATVGKRPDADEVAHVRRQFKAGAFPKRRL